MKDRLFNYRIIFYAITAFFTYHITRIIAYEEAEIPRTWWNVFPPVLFDMHLLYFCIGLFFLAIITSMFFPLPKNSVDFWYYTLAIVGVFLFAIETRETRGNLLNPLFEQQLLNEMHDQQKRVDFINDFQGANFIHDLIKKSALERVSKIGKLINKCENLESSEKVKLLELRSIDKGIGEPNCLDTRYLHLYHKLSIDPFYFVNNVAINEDKIENFERDYLLSIRWPVDTGYSTYSLIVLFANHTPESVKSLLKREDNTRKIENYRQLLISKNIVTKHDQSTLQSVYQFLVHNKGQIVLQLWPFMLVFALSLKLARTNIITVLIGNNGASD